MGLEKLEVDNIESMLQNSPIASCNFGASLVLSNFLRASRIIQPTTNQFLIVFWV